MMAPVLNGARHPLPHVAGARRSACIVAQVSPPQNQWLTRPTTKPAKTASAWTARAWGATRVGPSDERDASGEKKLRAARPEAGSPEAGSPNATRVAEVERGRPSAGQLDLNCGGDGDELKPYDWKPSGSSGGSSGGAASWSGAVYAFVGLSALTLLLYVGSEVAFGGYIFAFSVKVRHQM